MTLSRAKLVVAHSAEGTCIVESSAAVPQRWAVVRRARDGWMEAIHQFVGDGIFAGDAHRTSILAGPATRVLVRGITATPLRAGGAAGTATVIRAEAGATVLYLPGAIIPQVGSDHTASLRIQIAASAQVLAASVVVPGRSGMGERGRFRRLRLRFAAHVGGRLAFNEDATADPCTTALDSPGVFAGRGAYLTVLALGSWGPASTAWWDGIAREGVIGGPALLRSDGVCFRAVCDSLGDALDALSSVEGRVREGLPE